MSTPEPAPPQRPTHPAGAICPGGNKLLDDHRLIDGRYVCETAKWRQAFGDINAERMEQDRRFGGIDNDDRNTEADWIKYLRKHVQQAQDATPTDYRYQLVRVAALAVAAIEAFDRQRAMRIQPTDRIPCSCGRAGCNYDNHHGNTSHLADGDPRK